MRPYLITITMRDGSQGEHHGLYPTAIDAICFALDFFGDAMRISARKAA